MHVCRIAGQQDSSSAVARSLPSRVGEPRDPGGTVDSVVAPIHGDESLAQIAQRRLARLSNLRFGEHDTDGPALLVDHLAVFDVVLHLAYCMRAGATLADAQRRFLGHLDFGAERAPRPIPARELDASCLTDHPASAVAPDQELPPQAFAVGHL